MEKEEFLNQIKPKPYLINKEYDFQKRYESLLEIAGVICPGFNISKEQQNIYENAVKYFSGDDSCEFDLKKGLYIYGRIGNGKTLFFKLLNTLNKAVWSGNDFNILTINDLVDGIAREGYKYFSLSGITLSGDGLNLKNVNNIWIRHMLIDDMGQGVSSIRYFGSEVNVIRDFFQRRYCAFTDCSALTHVATNIPPAEIKEEYGEFISSRMREMFNIIAFPGEDKRK